MKKSNRVSWAPGVKLCQVKLFLSDDFPIKVGVKTQDHLQTKTSLLLHSKGVDSDGHSSEFEGRHHANALKEKLSCIPQIKWKCPPKIVLDCNWHVAAGGESQEAETQKRREMRVLEAVYPYFAAIPPSSSVSLDVEECRQHDDSHTPLVPITPIEEGSPADMLSDIAEPPNASLNSQPLTLAQGVSISGNPNTSQSNPPSLKPSAYEKPAFETFPGLEANAAAALAALVKSNEQGSLIDTDLLIKFLSDPKMIEKLSNENKAPANFENAPISRTKPMIPSIPLLSLKPDEIKKFANKCEAPSNPGTAPATQSNLVTPLVPFPSSKPSVVMINEYRGPENSGNEPGSIQSTQFCTEPGVGVLPIPMLNPVENMVQPGLPVKPCRMDAVPTFSFSAMTAPPAKDFNYCKSLIKLHGERPETQYHDTVSQYVLPYNDLRGTKLVPSIKPIESNTKNQKPCIYFNSSKGCRKGSLCPYKHDMRSKLRSGGALEASSAKRMKLGGEITCTYKVFQN
ncbi:zinc finger CCCH domain-containing protein 6-like [Cornus florida]|uniref:zinc finger CCCH domain-containing protein 6-like n=1 Tax=Cornus florida TaxID=4283 RepID=UPI0028A15F22|nr:zinc finger CCCH domain-containing protein 6-like [Cornus florida]